MNNFIARFCPRVGVAVGVGLAALFSNAVVAQSEEGFERIKPTLICVKNNEDGSYVARFGYVNWTGMKVSIPVGGDTQGEWDNYFRSSLADGEEAEEAAKNKGQPTDFLPGEHILAFDVTGQAQEQLVWKLGYSHLHASADFGIKCGEVYPVVNCVTRTEDESGDAKIIAHLGYINTGDTTVTIPVGDPQNCVVEDGMMPLRGGEDPNCDRGQPTEFLPGQHDGVFTVTGLSGTYEIRWYLLGGTNSVPDNMSEVGGLKTSPGGSSKVASTNHQIFANGMPVRACNVKPVSNCIESGCNLEGQTGNYTAVWGYENFESFNVTIPVGVGNFIFPKKECAYGPFAKGEDGSFCLGTQTQPTVFEPGVHNKVAKACFTSSAAGVLGWKPKDGEQNLLNEIKTRLMSDSFYETLENIKGYVLWNLGGQNYWWYHSVLDQVDYYVENIALHYYFSVLAEEFHSPICNRAPVCNAGGDYVLDCSGDITNVFLTGLGTKDPENDALSYSWTTDCTQSSMYTPATANPVLGLVLPGDGEVQNCKVSLTVKETNTEDGYSATCDSTVSVKACPVDCFKEAYGHASVDLCGKCGGNNDCVDCAGVPFGTSRLDDCGICGGNGSACSLKYDCKGVVNGTSVLDRCGSCDGDGTSCLQCSERDVRTVLMDLVGIGQKQLAVMRSAISGTSGANKTRALKALNTAKTVINKNAAVIWGIPGVSTYCKNTTLCVKVSNAPTIGQVATNATTVKTLGNTIVKLVAQQNKTQSKRIARKLGQLADEFSGRLSVLPEASSKCN